MSRPNNDQISKGPTDLVPTEMMGSVKESVMDKTLNKFKIQTPKMLAGINSVAFLSNPKINLDKSPPITEKLDGH